MATRRKATSARSVRQSVTIPAGLASEVRRTAKEQHVTMSRALVALAERGVRAEAEVAVKRIAEAVKGRNPKAAEEALKRLQAKP